LRQAYDTGFSQLIPKLPDTKYSEVQLSTSKYDNCNEDHLRAFWITRSEIPKENEGQVLLYLHGGGFVLGSLTMYEGITSRLVHSTKRKILFLDYDLVPETTIQN